MGQLTLSHTNSANVLKIRENLPRKTIEEALYDAWMDKPPQNPHNDPEILKVEALIANDIFNAYLRPALRIAIGAPHYIEGPEKEISRAAKKKKGAFGDNCDWARHSNLLKDMNMAEKASDLLSQRGVLTTRGPEGLPLKLYIIDTDNAFIEAIEKKPGLRMINTKFLIPIPLKDGESTYHVLELRSYLASSAEAYERSEEEYQKYRTKHSIAEAFSKASETTSDPKSAKRLSIEYRRSAKAAAEHLSRRTLINEEDAEMHDANRLLGYTPNPEASLPKGSSFTTFKHYLETNHAVAIAEYARSPKMA